MVITALAFVFTEMDMTLVLTSLVALGLLTAPPSPPDFQGPVSSPSSVTLVSQEIPWDGSDIEVAATAAAPPEDPEPQPLALGEVASRGAGIAEYPNGSVPSELLCAVPWSPSFQVYCPTLEALTGLNAEYRSTFGTDLSFASAYRAGFAGRSFHGWGMAIDLNGPSGLLGFGDAQFDWLMNNAPRYGWYLPYWAGASGQNPEPWHWEFGSYYRGTEADFASAIPENPVRWIKH